MFTDNFNKIQKLYFGATSSVSLVRCDGVSCGLNMDKTGSKAGLVTAMSTVRCTTQEAVKSGSSTSLNYPGIWLGTGSTPPTKDDYRLESVIQSGLSLSNGSFRSVNGDDGKYTYIMEIVLRNTTESEIVIREIGLFGQPVTGSNSPFANHLVLLRRDVLDNPITIPVGEARLVTFTLTFNQPSQ